MSEFHRQLQLKIDQKTKPLGALGLLETLAFDIATIQQTLTPTLIKPYLLVFAADHGLSESGVSAYPAEVTAQMMMNFVDGGAAVNVFSRENGIGLKVIDAGVKSDLPESLFDEKTILNRKIDYGTRNCLHEPAMTQAQYDNAMQSGAKIIDSLRQAGTNIVGFGEMGIGNTSASALLMSQFCDVPIEQCVGKGAGLDEAGVRHKQQVLRQVINQHGQLSDPQKILTIFGGFEIVMMCGAMIEAAKHHMIILVDGFISTVANLAAQKIAPAVRAHSIYCHQSEEQAHKKLLDYLKATPVMRLDLRLGEGSGVALCYPLIRAAVAFLNDMASFDSAGVSSANEKSAT